MFAAVLSGARNISEIHRWASDVHAQRPFGFKVPSLGTFTLFTRRLDPQALMGALRSWHAAVRPAPSVVAVDGKEIRGTKAGDRAYLLCVVDHATKAVLAQEPVGAKTNEIPHFRPALAPLVRPGLTVTADALHTQASHATWLEDHGAYYVFTVKGNQRSLLDRLMETNWNIGSTTARTIETGHGRIETRTLTLRAAPANLVFPGVRLIARMTRERVHTATGARTAETVYLITNLPPGTSARKLLRIARGHWTVENNLHWVKDTAWGEDKNTLRTGTGPELVSALYNLAITVLRTIGLPKTRPTLQHLARNPRGLPCRCLRLGPALLVGRVGVPVLRLRRWWAF
jgi:predicted transposase YbfD/YdcC